MKLLVPLLMTVVGFAIGGGVGFMTRPESAIAETDTGVEDGEHEDASKSKNKDYDTEDASNDRAYVKMNNQFVIPVLGKTRVTALVVLSLSLEVASSDTEAIYSQEPKLRDAFISVLFDYAYTGGFSEDFVSSPNLDTLRMKLLEAANAATTQNISKVLITDMVRQDS